MKRHIIERTSPRGPGQKFIGTCRLCGKPSLTTLAALQECENVRGLSVDEAMVETILGDQLPE